jgi:site-specific DNA-methyltransferase (adenine-specific)
MFPKRYVSSTGYVKYQHEAAHLLVKGTPWSMADTISDVIDWSYSGNILHPTQKPLEILTPLIETFCPKDGLVLDPFAGSGSTLAAAKKTERRWLGIELDARYFEIARTRLQTDEPAAA